MYETRHKQSASSPYKFLLASAFGGILVMALFLVGTGSFTDEALQAVEAHPMATPSLSFGEITYQRAETDRRTTVALFERGPKFTRATTSVAAPEERIPELFAEIRAQAEALGYEFEPGDWSFELKARAIADYPGISLVIAEHRESIRIDVYASRSYFE